MTRMRFSTINFSHFIEEKICDDRPRLSVSSAAENLIRPLIPEKTFPAAANQRRATTGEAKPCGSNSVPGLLCEGQSVRQTVRLTAFIAEASEERKEKEEGALHFATSRRKLPRRVIMSPPPLSLTRR